MQSKRQKFNPKKKIQTTSNITASHHTTGGTSFPPLFFNSHIVLPITKWSLLKEKIVLIEAKSDLQEVNQLIDQLKKNVQNLSRKNAINTMPNENTNYWSTILFIVDTYSKIALFNQKQGSIKTIASMRETENLLLSILRAEGLYPLKESKVNVAKIDIIMDNINNKIFTSSQEYAKIREVIRGKIAFNLLVKLKNEKNLLLLFENQLIDCLTILNINEETIKNTIFPILYQAFAYNEIISTNNICTIFDPYQTRQKEGYSTQKDEEALQNYLNAFKVHFQNLNFMPEQKYVACLLELFIALTLRDKSEAINHYNNAIQQLHELATKDAFQPAMTMWLSVAKEAIKQQYSHLRPEDRELIVKANSLLTENSENANKSQETNNKFPFMTTPSITTPNKVVNRK